MSKWRPYLLSLFSGKNTITFCNIWDILARKKGGVTSQRGRIKIWQIPFHPHYSWWNFCKKKFGSNVSQFCGYRSHRTFQRNFNPHFQIWLVFLVPFLHVLRTSVNLADAEFNAESIGTIFESQKWKSKKLLCPFLIALFYFETKLIKKRLFLFSSSFWAVVKFIPRRSEAEKLACSDKYFCLANSFKR